MSYKMLYLARTNSFLAKKGDLFEIDPQHTKLTSLKTNVSVQMKDVYDFEKHFLPFAYPKVFHIDGKPVVVSANQLSFNGKSVKPLEFFRTISAINSNKNMQVSALKFYGVEMSVSKMKDIEEYLNLVIRDLPDASPE